MERSNGTAPKSNRNSLSYRKLPTSIPLNFAENLKIKINVNVDGGNVNQEVNGNGRAVNGAVHQRSTAEKPSNAKGTIPFLN